MNFFVRGFLSVKERLGKSVLLFLVITTISVFVLAGFSIKSATEKASVLARQKLGATVTLSPDMEKIKEQMRAEGGGNKFQIQKTPINMEDVTKVLTLENISDYNLIVASEAKADNFDEIASSTTNDFSNMMGNKMPQMPSGDITIEGVRYMTEDAGTMISGRAITDEDEGTDVVVIEETLAEENDLKVGDKIKVDSIDGENNKELEVVGIYRTNSEITDSAIKNNAMNPYNKIYGSYTLVNDLNNTEDVTVDRAEFYVDDPINVQKVLEEGNKLNIDFDTYKLDANNSAYEQMMGPIENVGSFANTTVIIVSVAGAIILTLIIMISIKERRNEIGIFLALGEGKAKIIGQFIVEILIVLTLAIGVSGIIGNSISKNMGDMLLQKEVVAQEESISSNSGMKPGRGPGGFNLNKKVQDIETIEELDVKVTGEDFGKMAGISVIISLLGIAIPSVGIMRLQPKEILSRHD